MKLHHYFCEGYMKKNGIPDDYLTKVKASIVDSSRNFIGIADVDGRLIYLNPAAYKMMGYDEHEHPDCASIADLHANNFDQFALDVVQPVAFTKGSWTGTGFLKHKDGSIVTVSQTVFPVYGDDGTQYGTAAIMNDIAELIRMNEQVQKSNELLQKILDSAKIGIVLINMETNTIEMINKFTTELLQMDAEKILGCRCNDILCHLPMELCPHVNERNVPTISAERFIKRSDGTSIPIIKSGTWISINGKDYLVDTFVDISIQKDLEKSLSDAKISAEAANRSKSEFLSRMSHEMRTPLNAVIGMAQIAERTDNLEKLKSAIDTIEISSKHLLELINDVLDLSKIEEGKLNLSIEPFLFTAMVKKIRSLIEPKAKEKNIVFSIHIDDGIPEKLTGDSMRLSQVLLNFLTNAVKFTPEKGNVSLSIFNAGIRGDTASLRFMVADNGIGISAEQLSRLFNPFVQAENSISRRYGGTGLGLAISKQILSLMHAEINVDSKYGEGSTFSFNIELPVSGQVSPLANDIDLEHMAGIFAGKKALIVDDVELNRLIASELLSVTGIETDDASDGAEALNKVAEKRYDIIFMDIQMPVMDGYEATRQIRELEDPAARNIVVAMSANVFKEDIELSLAAGMDGHIGKPVDLQNMIATSLRLLSPEKNQGAGGAEKSAVFRQDFRKTAEQNPLINIPRALNYVSGDETALAHSLDAFLRDGLFTKLKTALEKNSYEEAVSLSRQLHIRANELAMAGISSYAGNVYECLRKNDIEYAKMYMADLAKCYQNTSRIIIGLLE